MIHTYVLYSIPYRLLDSPILMLLYVSFTYLYNHPYSSTMDIVLR